MDDQTTPPAADPVAPPASDGGMTGDQVVDTAKDVLSNEPAMDMGSGPTPPASTDFGSNDSPAGDLPTPAPVVPESGIDMAPPEEPAPDAPTPEAEPSEAPSEPAPSSEESPTDTPDAV